MCKIANKFVASSRRRSNSSCLAAVLLLLFVWISEQEGGGVLALEHCSLNNYQQSLNSSHLQYTKEPVTREYAVLNQFKSLHCCAKGYRSIEWFKDGKPYPFPGLILFPEEANQTIYAREVNMAVAGNYTCVLRNDTHKMEHHIELIVKGSPPETPLATFQPQNIEELQEGGIARFYCEAFIGTLGLPDEKSEISWYRISPNGDLEQMHSVEIIPREDEHVLGAILTLSSVREEDYGDYLCRIEMANPTHRLELKASLHISPTVAKTVSNRHILSTVVAVITAFVIVLLICVVFLGRHRQRRHKLNSLTHREQMYDSATVEMSLRRPTSGQMRP